ALQASEKVEGLRVSKGLVWQGQPALLQLEMVDGASRAVASLAVDGTAPTGNDPAALDAMLARMLGLGDGADQLALQHGKHPVLGPLLLGQMGLRVPASSSPFEALVWAITGQQISVAAAI